MSNVAKSESCPGGGRFISIRKLVTFRPRASVWRCRRHSVTVLIDSSQHAPSSSAIAFGRGLPPLVSQIGPFERLHASFCRAPSGWGAGASGLCMGRVLQLMRSRHKSALWSLRCLFAFVPGCMFVPCLGAVARAVCGLCLTACDAPSGEWGQSISGSPLQISPPATWEACLLFCLRACLACTRWPGSGRSKAVPEVQGHWLPFALGRVCDDAAATV